MTHALNELFFYLLDSSLTVDIPPSAEELEAFTNSIAVLPEIVSNVPPLEEIISNVIAVTSGLTITEENNSQQPHSRSDYIEIPSTSSGYLLANTVDHDNIMASLSNPSQTPPQRGESLPDRDYLETISVATATLSTFLSNTDQNEDVTKEGIDSGISTENTSLDRSPSLDLNNTDLKKENSDFNNKTCHFSIDNNDSELNIDNSASERTNNLSSPCSTSKKCFNSSPNLRRKGTSVTTPRHRKRLHHQKSSGLVNGCFSNTLSIPTVVPTGTTCSSLCSSETSTYDSDCADDEEIALAMQAAEIANRNEVRNKFR